PYFHKPLRTALVDCTGELLYEMVTSLAGEPHGRPEWQVPIEKLWLYSAPNDSARTEHYLVRNELAEMLAFVNEDWMKIAYQGTEGRQKAWVSLRATHDLGERYEPGISDHEPLALWALDYYDSEEDP